jgi:hypothetical protein
MKGKGNRPTKYLIIDTLFLQIYFKVCRQTIKRWIKSKKIDPTNIDMLVELKQLRNINP